LKHFAPIMRHNKKTLSFNFRLTFEDVVIKRAALQNDEELPEKRIRAITVVPHKIPNRGPYPSSKVKK
jgi:hypothetical protein